MSSPRSYLLQWVYHSPVNDVYPTRYEPRYEARAVFTNKVSRRKTERTVKSGENRKCGLRGRFVARGFRWFTQQLTFPSPIPLFRPLRLRSFSPPLIMLFHLLKCPPPQNASHSFSFLPCPSSPACACRRLQSLSFSHSCCPMLPTPCLQIQRTFEKGEREAGHCFCPVSE